jgi:hypothetical protein
MRERLQPPASPAANERKDYEVENSRSDPEVSASAEKEPSETLHSVSDASAAPASPPPPPSEWDENSPWHHLAKGLAEASASMTAAGMMGPSSPVASSATAKSEHFAIGKDSILAAQRVEKNFKRGLSQLRKTASLNERVRIATQTLDSVSKGPKGTRLADIASDPDDPRDPTTLVRRYAAQLRSYLQPAERGSNATIDPRLAELDHEFRELVGEFGSRREVRAEALLFLVHLGIELIRNPGLEKPREAQP